MELTEKVALECDVTGRSPVNDSLDITRESTAALTIQRNLRGYRSRQRVWKYTERVRNAGDFWRATRKLNYVELQSRRTAVRVGVVFYDRCTIVAKVCFLSGWITAIMTASQSCDRSSHHRPPLSPTCESSFVVFFTGILIGFVGVAACLLQGDPNVKGELFKGLKAVLWIMAILLLCVAGGLIYQVATDSCKQKSSQSAAGA